MNRRWREAFVNSSSLLSLETSPIPRVTYVPLFAIFLLTIHVAEKIGKERVIFLFF
jgi:hypothetical protein